VKNHPDGRDRPRRREAYARELGVTVNPRTGTVFTPWTIARRLSAVSSFYTFAVNVGAVARNPVAAADRPAVDRDHSPTVGLAEREVAALLAAPDADPYPAAAAAGRRSGSCST
jgi:site-specific recombinase XerD